jgi:hypothetical protein
MAVVEQRVAHLDAGRFGHGAHLAQVVVGQGELQVQVHQTVDVMIRRGAFIDFGQCASVDAGSTEWMKSAAKIWSSGVRWRKL